MTGHGFRSYALRAMYPDRGAHRWEHLMSSGLSRLPCAGRTNPTYETADIPFSELVGLVGAG
jgi:hypothetical protein